MDVRNSVLESQTACIFFVFPRHPPTQQLCHFPFSMLRCGCPHYSLQLLTTDPDIYIPHLSLRGKAKAEQGESILRGKRQRGEELGPARALLPSCAPRLACQRSRINPLPGTPARIIGHNHMWQPAHEPVIRAAPAPALCKSRAIVTVWFQVTVSLLTWNALLSSMKNAHAKYFTRSGWVALGLCLSAGALDWLSGRSRSEMCTMWYLTKRKVLKWFVSYWPPLHLALRCICGDEIAIGRLLIAEQTQCLKCTVEERTLYHLQR